MSKNSENVKMWKKKKEVERINDEIVNEIPKDYKPPFDPEMVDDYEY